MIGSARRFTPAARLWKWFQNIARDLPWRLALPDGLRDPYRVWLAEVMLQQTQVKTVIPYYEKFLRHYPDLHALAHAPQEKVLADWAGLGYYSRARNLYACAKYVVNELNGQWPRTAAELQKLPGLGPYTAAALAALAFGEETVAIDGNVARVLSRYGAIKKPLNKARAELTTLGKTLLYPKARGGSAEALIELGAMICTPKNPRCGECPLRTDCKAFAADAVEKYPVKERKAVAKTREARALVLTNPKGEIFTITRGGKGLFAGMVAIPTSALQAGEKDHALWKTYSAKAAEVITVQHVLTHVKFVLTVYHAKVSAAAAKKIKDGAWMEIDAAQKQMPKLFGKAVTHAHAAIV